MRKSSKVTRMANWINGHPQLIEYYQWCNQSTRPRAYPRIQKKWIKWHRISQSYCSFNECYNAGGFLLETEEGILCSRPVCSTHFIYCQRCEGRKIYDGKFCYECGLEIKEKCTNHEICPMHRNVGIGRLLDMPFHINALCSKDKESSRRFGLALVENPLPEIHAEGNISTWRYEYEFQAAHSLKGRGGYWNKHSNRDCYYRDGILCYEDDASPVKREKFCVGRHEEFDARGRCKHCKIQYLENCRRYHYYNCSSEFLYVDEYFDRVADKEGYKIRLGHLRESCSVRYVPKVLQNRTYIPTLIQLAGCVVAKLDNSQIDTLPTVWRKQVYEIFRPLVVIRHFCIRCHCWRDRPVDTENCVHRFFPHRNEMVCTMCGTSVGYTEQNKELRIPLNITFISPRTTTV